MKSVKKINKINKQHKPRSFDYVKNMYVFNTNVPRIVLDNLSKSLSLNFKVECTEFHYLTTAQ